MVIATHLVRTTLMLDVPVPAKQFQLVLIKPSHYDDDGYVIRWWRALIPSNSLAAVYAIAADCAKRQVLGPDVAIDIEAIDETNTRVDVAALVARLRRHRNFGLVALVGVQTNQYPRALDIARPFRTAGISVAIGGFHVSGCLSMLDGRAVGLDACRELGISIFAGEAENRLDMLLRDAADGRLAAQYDFIKDLPELADTPVPFLPKQYVARTLGLSASFDAGRGCPYQCSFCTIINVQGRKSRFRSADDIEHLIRLNWAQGIHKFFITDDNFARNREWEPIFDRLILLRERDAIPLGLMIQVDTLCHKIPNFIEKAKRAGVTRVFIGLENINPDNLAGAKKRQNKITEYRRMLLAWKAQGIITLAGYILGFPSDTAETIRRDIAIIQEELPLDIVEFFCLTPLPGSEDHQKLWRQGVAMDADMNRYDVEHVVTAHPKMTRAEWERAYLTAWKLYYSHEHIERLLRRAAACGIGVSRLATMIFGFSCAVEIEGIHPLQSGILRLKYRTDRRPGLPIEPAWRFYPALIAETLHKMSIYFRKWLFIERLRRSIRKDPARTNYRDEALAPVEASDTETLALFTHNEAARSAVQHARRIKELTTPKASVG